MQSLIQACILAIKREVTKFLHIFTLCHNALMVEKVGRIVGKKHWVLQDKYWAWNKITLKISRPRLVQNLVNEHTNLIIHDAMINKGGKYMRSSHDIYINFAEY
jgi:hypothetical protein